MSQFALPLAWPADERDAEFVVTPAGAAALRVLERWRDWPVRTAILTGPPRSGRSLLARIFTERTGGQAIDDADRVDETALFHAWNRAEEHAAPQLLVAAAAPPAWSIALADLRTRLAASPVASIGAPDDALVTALIERGFERHRLAARPDLIAWLTARIDRRHEAVIDAVDRIAAAALAEGRRLSVPFVRDTLGGRLGSVGESEDL